MASSPSDAQQKTGTLSGSRFFFVWLWGIPLAWLTTALILGAEEFRLGGMPVAGDALDVIRLAVYWYWCRLAWRSAGDGGNPLRALLTKAALAAGLAVTVLV